MSPQKQRRPQSASTSRRKGKAKIKRRVRHSASPYSTTPRNVLRSDSPQRRVRQSASPTRVRQTVSPRERTVGFYAASPYSEGMTRPQFGRQSTPPRRGVSPQKGIVRGMQGGDSLGMGNGEERRGRGGIVLRVPSLALDERELMSPPGNRMGQPLFGQGSRSAALGHDQESEVCEDVATILDTSDVVPSPGHVLAASGHVIARSTHRGGRERDGVPDGGGHGHDHDVDAAERLASDRRRRRVRVRGRAREMESPGVLIQSQGGGGDGVDRYSEGLGLSFEGGGDRNFQMEDTRAVIHSRGEKSSQFMEVGVSPEDSGVSVGEGGQRRRRRRPRD